MLAPRILWSLSTAVVALSLTGSLAMPTLRAAASAGQATRPGTGARANARRDLRADARGGRRGDAQGRQGRPRTTSSTTSDAATAASPSPRPRSSAPRGIGIDIDPQRIEEANANVRQAGVGNRVQFLQPGSVHDRHQRGDGRHAVSAASLNMKLRPKLIEGAQARHAHRLARVRHGRLEAGADARRRRPEGLLLDDSQDADGPAALRQDFSPCSIDSSRQGPGGVH